MTSSSAIERLVPLVLLTLAAACAAQPVEETQALVVAESEACRLAAVGGTTVNHYRAILFAFTGWDEDSGESPCVNCIRTGRCPIAAVECGCAGAHPPITGEINRRLRGFGFADVVPDRPYCVGLVGLDDTASTVGRGDSSHACDCVEPTADALVRTCGITPFPGLVEENAGALFISMECGRACTFLMP